MELQTLNHSPSKERGIISGIDSLYFEDKANTIAETSTDTPFIQANTIDVSFEEVKNNHIIPVYIKDNEPLISHADFVDATMEVTLKAFSGETILLPNLRVSHPIKGRTLMQKINLLMSY